MTNTNNGWGWASPALRKRVENFGQNLPKNHHHDHDPRSTVENLDPQQDPRFSEKTRSHDHDPANTKNSRISNGAWIYNQVNHHPMLQMAVKTWGMEEKLLYRLIEEKGLDIVIRSIEFTRTYKPATVKGAYCTSLIRNGGPKRKQA